MNYDLIKTTLLEIIKEAKNLDEKDLEPVFNTKIMVKKGREQEFQALAYIYFEHLNNVLVTKDMDYITEVYNTLSKEAELEDREYYESKSYDVIKASEEDIKRLKALMGNTNAIDKSYNLLVKDLQRALTLGNTLEQKSILDRINKEINSLLEDKEAIDEKIGSLVEIINKRAEKFIDAEMERLLEDYHATKYGTKIDFGLDGRAILAKDKEEYDSLFNLKELLGKVHKENVVVLDDFLCINASDEKEFRNYLSKTQVFNRLEKEMPQEEKRENVFNNPEEELNSLISDLEAYLDKLGQKISQDTGGRNPRIVMTLKIEDKNWIVLEEDILEANRIIEIMKILKEPSNNMVNVWNIANVSVDNITKFKELVNATKYFEAEVPKIDANEVKIKEIKEDLKNLMIKARETKDGRLAKNTYVLEEDLKEFNLMNVLLSYLDHAKTSDDLKEVAGVKIESVYVDKYLETLRELEELRKEKEIKVEESISLDSKSNDSENINKNVDNTPQDINDNIDIGFQDKVSEPQEENKSISLEGSVIPIPLLEEALWVKTDKEKLEENKRRCEHFDKVVADLALNNKEFYEVVSGLLSDYKNNLILLGSFIEKTVNNGIEPVAYNDIYLGADYIEDYKRIEEGILEIKKNLELKKDEFDKKAQEKLVIEEVEAPAVNNDSINESNKEPVVDAILRDDGNKRVAPNESLALAEPIIGNDNRFKVTVRKLKNLKAKEYIKEHRKLLIAMGLVGVVSTLMITSLPEVLIFANSCNAMAFPGLAGLFNTLSNVIAGVNNISFVNGAWLSSTGEIINASAAATKATTATLTCVGALVAIEGGFATVSKLNKKYDLEKKDGAYRLKEQKAKVKDTIFGISKTLRNKVYNIKTEIEDLSQVVSDKIKSSFPLKAGSQVFDAPYEEIHDIGDPFAQDEENDRIIADDKDTQARIAKRVQEFTAQNKDLFGTVGEEDDEILASDSTEMLIALSDNYLDGIVPDGLDKDELINKMEDKIVELQTLFDSKTNNFDAYQVKKDLDRLQKNYSEIRRGRSL